MQSGEKSKNKNDNKLRRSLKHILFSKKNNSNLGNDVSEGVVRLLASSPQFVFPFEMQHFVQFVWNVCVHEHCIIFTRRCPKVLFLRREDKCFGNQYSLKKLEKSS